jgi:hypothetical protein
MPRSVCWRWPLKKQTWPFTNGGSTMAISTSYVPQGEVRQLQRLTGTLEYHSDSGIRTWDLLTTSHDLSHTPPTAQSTPLWIRGFEPSTLSKSGKHTNRPSYKWISVPPHPPWSYICLVLPEFGDWGEVHRPWCLAHKAKKWACRHAWCKSPLEAVEIPG